MTHLLQLLWRFFFIGLLGTAAAAEASDEAQQAIQATYASTFAAMRQAKTKDDIVRIVNGINAPEWVGKMPAGETLTREDVLKEGEAALEIPPEKRPIPKMDIVYTRETGWNLLVVYWMYHQSGEKIVGSLARDTWVRTAQGWRRISLEKFFPDRPLPLPYPQLP
jgi:hypothetical protein